MILDSLKQIVGRNSSADPLYLRNLLKENLQFYVLNWVYNSVWGENLIFKGGSCLRMCFDLPRLSEDLDLDISKTAGFDTEKFIDDLATYFSESLQYRELTISRSKKGNIIKLRFPILDKLGLSISDQSKTLFLRIDLTWAKGRKFKTEISLKSTYDFSFLVRRYSLADLFAGKIAAILSRQSMEGEETVARTKGRDYFDLAWFLEKKVEPNFEYLAEITGTRSKRTCAKMLQKKVLSLEPVVLRQDLRPLFIDQKFVERFVVNYKDIVLPILKGWGG